MRPLNKIYRLVWSRRQGRLVVASEIAKSSRKGPKLKLSIGALILLTAVRAFAQVAPDELPTGGSVQAGSAAISTTGSQMTVQQATDQAIFEWQTFNIGRDAGVSFQQPNLQSVALNRVLSNDPSKIYGTLSANGQIFFVNPSGIIFGESARVDVGGLVASTLNITNEDFLAKRYNFAGTGGKIINHGSLTGGFIGLIAPDIENAGNIVARLGSVVIGAAEQAVLSFDQTGRISIAIDAAKFKSMIENSGSIISENGSVLLSASAAQVLVDDLIAAPSGADGLVSENGVVRLINSDGNIQAREIAIDAGETGGTEVNGTLNANSDSGPGGRIEVLGREVQVGSDAEVTARGLTGGGEILIGGDWQGADGVREATFTGVASGAVIDASAIESGDGGTIAIWSRIDSPDSTTFANGTLISTGGLNGGDGGRVETSGFYLNVDGISVDTSASAGENGLWLLDPYDITIDDGSSGLASNSFTASSTSTISASTIETALGSNNVSISTGLDGVSSSTVALYEGDSDSIASPTSAGYSLTTGDSIVFQKAVLNDDGTYNTDVNVNAVNGLSVYVSQSSEHPGNGRVRDGDEYIEISFRNWAETSNHEDLGRALRWRVVRACCWCQRELWKSTRF